jgi:hypothetical protein
MMFSLATNYETDEHADKDRDDDFSARTSIGAVKHYDSIWSEPAEERRKCGPPGHFGSRRLKRAAPVSVVSGRYRAATARERFLPQTC